MLRTLFDHFFFIFLISFIIRININTSIITIIIGDNTKVIAPNIDNTVSIPTANKVKINTNIIILTPPIII